jgi:hypothetical protein
MPATEALHRTGLFTLMTPGYLILSKLPSQVERPTPGFFALESVT